MSKDTKRPQDKTASQLHKERAGNVQPFPGTKNVEMVIENLSDLIPEKIHWIWQDIIAVGKITLFAGEPGVGKSQLLLYIAHILSIGGRFHFAKENTPEYKVLLIAGEDKMEDTVIPRLMALGSNRLNISHVRGIKKLDKNGREFYEPISLDEHLEDLEEKIIVGGFKVVIFDPISIYLGAIDDAKNKEIRSALARLNALCERLNVAVILNSHFTKPSGNMSKNAIYRVMGSIGFAAAARIIYGIMKDPEDANRRLFIPIKNNIAQDKEGFVYNVKLINVPVGDSEVQMGKIEWIDEKVTQTANEILNKPSEESSPKLEEAKNFLLEILKDGSVELRKIRQQSTDKNISVDRLYKAKDALKLVESESFSRSRGKIWSLPPL